MRTIAFVSSAGGVGKTNLVYHLAHMISRLGHPTLAVDLDPQATLSSWFLGEKYLEDLWDLGSGTIASHIAPLLHGLPDVEESEPIEVAESLRLIVGDPAIWNFEGPLSEAWAGCYQGRKFSLQVISAFHRSVQKAGRHTRSSVALLDLGNNLGSINKAALLAADFLVFPLAVETFSLHGLKILGPVIRDWHQQWLQLRQSFPLPTHELPEARMSPIGYVALRLNSFRGRLTHSHARWLDQVPAVYTTMVLGEEPTSVTMEEDTHCLAMLRNYGSLMSMAQEVRKPMFDLNPSDGALGSYSPLVRQCREDFEALATTLVQRCGLQRAPQAM